MNFEETKQYPWLLFLKSVPGISLLSPAQALGTAGPTDGAERATAQRVPGGRVRLGARPPPMVDGATLRRPGRAAHRRASSAPSLPLLDGVPGTTLALGLRCGAGGSGKSRRAQSRLWKLTGPANTPPLSWSPGTSWGPWAFTAPRGPTVLASRRSDLTSGRPFSCWRKLGGNQATGRLAWHQEERTCKHDSAATPSGPTTGLVPG